MSVEEWGRGSVRDSVRGCDCSLCVVRMCPWWGQGSRDGTGFMVRGSGWDGVRQV